MGRPAVFDRRDANYSETSHKFEIRTEGGLRGHLYYRKNTHTSPDGFGAKETYDVYPAGDKTYVIIAFCIYRLHHDGKLPHITRVGSPSKDLTR